MKSVSAAIIIENNTVLLARRAPGEMLSGYWEFPRGKQERNETILECLEREFYEEFKAQCRAIEIYAKSIYEYDSGSIKLVAIKATLEDKELTLHVHDRVEWIPFNDFLSYELAPADIPIAEKLVNENG
jgi:8-oxo-dGTP diphosphatase